MGLLYNRQIIVNVAGLTITEPRISLELARELDTVQSTGQCNIFNLKPANEERIYERGGPITIEAGYPTTISEIFSGEVQRVTRIRQNQARITRIQLGDQVRQKARLGGTTMRSYDGAVPVRMIATDLAADLDLPLGPLDAIPEAATYENFYWTGPSDAAMTALLRTVECRWYESDGVIRINRTGMVQSDAPTIAISPMSGLVKSPIITDEGLRLTLFLNPAVTLGCRIELTSETQSGSYKVVAINHVADNWTGRFITDTELREIAAPEAAPESAPTVQSL